MVKTRAQSALEYLMIIAITLAIIVPTTYLFFSYSSESNVEIIYSQINQIGRSMIEVAETVYYSGESSKVILTLNMPENVRGINIIRNRELVFNITSVVGETEVVFFSAVNISSLSCPTLNLCSLSDISGVGLKKIKFQSIANGNQVLISKSE